MSKFEKYISPNHIISCELYDQWYKHIKYYPAKSFLLGCIHIPGNFYNDGCYPFNKVDLEDVYTSRNIVIDGKVYEKCNLVINYSSGSFDRKYFDSWELMVEYVEGNERLSKLVNIKKL